MSVNNTISLKNPWMGAALFDIPAILFAYFVPALSHLSGIPIYLAEPMRLVIIFALLFTVRQNVYFLAITLPFFSFIVSAHPVLFKSLIISAELVLNVWLFYLLNAKINKVFPAILISIFVSKLVYYLLKFSLISFAVISGSLINTPILIQIISMLAFSIIIFAFYRKR